MSDIAEEVLAQAQSAKPRTHYAESVDAICDVFFVVMSCMVAAYAIGDLIRRYQGLDAAD